jgi:hypothetical protein
VVQTGRRILRMRDESDALFFQEFHPLASPAAHKLHPLMILVDPLHLSWTLAALPLVLFRSLRLLSRQDIRSYYCSSPSVRASNHSTGSATSDLETSKGAQIYSRRLKNVVMSLVGTINSPSSNSFAGAFLAPHPLIRPS